MQVSRSSRLLQSPLGSRSVWITGAFWAVADQGVWSLTNFLFNLFLVKRLGPRSFGVYSVAYSVLLVASSVQNCLLLEPMSVIAAAKAERRERSWLEPMARVQTRFGVYLALALAAAAFIAWRLGFEFAPCLTALAAGFPFLAALTFRRRVAYMENVPLKSARAGMVNLAIVFAAALICNHLGALNPTSAFLISGLAAMPSLLSISRLDSFPMEPNRRLGSRLGRELVGALALR